MAKSVDPDLMPCSVVSDLDLNCLLRPVSPTTYLIQSNFDGSNPFFDHENLFETAVVRTTEGYY